MVKTADKNLKQDKDYSLSKGYFQTLLTFLYKDVINKDKKDLADSKPPIDSPFNKQKRPFNYCMVEKMAYVPNLKSHRILSKVSQKLRAYANCSFSKDI